MIDNEEPTPRQQPTKHEGAAASSDEQARRLKSRAMAKALAKKHRELLEALKKL